MKVRMFDDGSAQFLPEPGDGEFPQEPVLPPKSAELTALEEFESEIGRSGTVESKIALAQAKALRKREEEQYQANVAAFEKNKPKGFVGSGGKVLSKAEAAERPWQLSLKEQIKRGIVKKKGAK